MILNIMPQLRLSPGDIDLSIKFFEKEISMPIIISCMTGGAPEAQAANSKLALVASKLGIPIGVGSQRQVLEDSSYIDSYKIIRKNAPEVPVLGNIGAAQVKKMKDSGPFLKMIEMIDADAMVIHLNPLQELMQGEGEPDFKGFLKSLEKIIKEIKVPVIIKEVGAGISARVAAKLLSVGVKGIDVAGAGGTSWAGVELLRRNGGNAG